MHELTITQNILDISLRFAQKSEAKQINYINIIIGELSSMVDDSIQFYWETIAKGTIAEKAIINFQRIPAELICNDCGFSFELSTETFNCPKCNSHKVKIFRGDELMIESIEVE